jgi:phospholipase C
LKATSSKARAKAKKEEEAQDDEVEDAVQIEQEGEGFDELFGELVESQDVAAIEQTGEQSRWWC